jgi:hypothetical protein
MTRACARALWLAAAVGAIVLRPVPGFAQAPPRPAVRGASRAEPAATNAALKCPVDTFREVLAMNPAEREEYLSSRPLPSRRLMEAKLREYESLSPNLRELRLRVTELHWYLLPLMTTPATNRADQVARIPREVRSMVADRIQKWDPLPPDAKDRFLQHLYEPERDGEATNVVLVPPLPPGARESLERGVQQWRRMNEEQRQQIEGRFYQFLELTVQERDITLHRLSEPEREQIEKTLEVFARLNQSQRTACFESFEKFASLSLGEREQFMQNAQRWEQMSPQDRQDLKDLVEWSSRLPPLPPRPPTLATNGEPVN